MNLPQLPQDKANHALYGAVISLVVGFFLGPVFGLAAAGAAGAIKEGLDAYQNHKSGQHLHDVDALDFLATLAGGVLVYAASF